MSIIKLTKLQGIGHTLESRLDYDKTIIESMLRSIKSLTGDITSIDMIKLCLANVMKDAKGNMDPNYANQVIKDYLERYIK